MMEHIYVTVSEAPAPEVVEVNEAKAPHSLYDPKWERVPEYQPWLKKNKVTGNAHCIYCNLDINTQHGKCRLSGHLERVKHRKNEKLWLKTHQKVNPNPDLAVSSPEKPVTQHMRQTEAHLVAFLAENKLSLGLTEPMVDLLKNLPSVGETVETLQFSAEKASRIIKRGLSTHLKQPVIRKLKSLLFSLVFKEVKQGADSRFLVLCVCYRDEDLHIQVDILDVYEETTNDGDLFNNLRQTLAEVEEGEVPIKNWVGFLIDTKDSLFVTTHQLAVMISECYPWVISIRCPSHMTDQAVASACEKLPLELANFCNTLHRCLSATDTRLETLLSLQVFCHMNRNKDGEPPASGVRWLSVEKFIKHVVDLWEPLTAYFTEQTEKDPLNGDSLTTLEILQSPLYKVLLQFVEHVLSIVSTYNQTFQAERPSFFQLEHETKELVQRLALSFMRVEVVKAIPDVMALSFPEEYLCPLASVYLGLDASGSLNSYMVASSLTFESPEVLDIMRMCRQFYMDIILEIQSRFDFSHPVFHLAGIVNPQNARSMRPPSLSELFTNFDHPNWNKSKIEGEWRALCNLALPGDRERLKSPQQFWKYIFSIRSGNGGLRFGNLRQVILFFLSLPISSIIGLKVSRFLESINIKGRIGIMKTSLIEYSTVDSSLDKEHYSQAKRRRPNKGNL